MQNRLLKSEDLRVFTESEISSIQEAKFVEVNKDGVLPEDAYLTTSFVEYVKVNNKMLLPKNHMLKACVVKKDDELVCVCPRNLKVSDLVLVAPTQDKEFGIFRDENAFKEIKSLNPRNSAFTGSTDRYKRLFKMIKEVHEANGKIAWVLGPAVVFDFDTRKALWELANEGYVSVLLAGNAMATHDLEGGYLATALGQNIYTQESVPNGHYNHLDLLNVARHHKTLKDFIDSGKVKDGFIKKMVELNLPIVLCGSIRDDGPLPEVYHEVSAGLDRMHEELKDVDLIITLATLLHSVSSVECAPTYRVKNGKIYPTYVTSVDIADYATNAVVEARNNYLVDAIVTNVQDFCVNTRNNVLNYKEKEGRIK